MKLFSGKSLLQLILSSKIQRAMAVIFTVILSFLLIETGAAPEKYKLSVGTPSQYDINAPRDIENKKLTEENAKKAANSVPSVIKEIRNAPVDVFKSLDDFVFFIDDARRSFAKLKTASNEDKQALSTGEKNIIDKFISDIGGKNILLSSEQSRYLIVIADDQAVASFEKILRDIVLNSMKADITESTLPSVVNSAQNELQLKDINQELKNIGLVSIKSLLKPNREVDTEATNKKKEEAAASKDNVVKILKGERIISNGEIVSEDKMLILQELNLVEAGNRFDITLAVGTILAIGIITLIIWLYLKRCNLNLLTDRNFIIILCLIITVILAAARILSPQFSLVIPVFILPMTIAAIFDLRLAIFLNLIVSAAVMLITQENTSVLLITLIGGTTSAFFSSKASERSRLSLAGIITGLTNAGVILFLGLISKSGAREISLDAVTAFMNGVLSMILTIGLMPFWESAFNVITPLKLLELANPNQPLLKRLLMEAPGTYHHSLMVGNLAEVAAEAIGGNSLLARVGAYYHDIGKLSRPDFFKENQLGENPHDRITPNLSTLIITAHTENGDELAKKYKIPVAVRDIIKQHHGTTVLAYFYHKALKGEKGDLVQIDNFRYGGPRPSTKEAAVVMLADSVEAAVRSLPDKTEGKIEGLIRKIIKDKLDDGQLDQCELTLKDLDTVADSFMHVFGGFFHERTQYPDIKLKVRNESEENNEIKEKINENGNNS